MVTIRRARVEDGPVIQDIERRAGEQFRELGMDEVADEEVESLGVLAQFALDGRDFVAVGSSEDVIGYVLLEMVDGAAYVHQVSVAPEFQGRGVGRALLEQADTWAVELQLTRVILTTFDNHVPWNRPLYEHLGFAVLATSEIGAELRAIQQTEASRGLRRRVAMGRAAPGRSVAD